MKNSREIIKQLVRLIYKQVAFCQSAATAALNMKSNLFPSHKQLQLCAGFSLKVRIDFGRGSPVHCYLSIWSGSPAGKGDCRADIIKH